MKESKEICFLCETEANEFTIEKIDNETVCLCANCKKDLKETAIRLKKIIRQLQKQLKDIELTHDKQPKGNPFDEGYIIGVIDALTTIKNKLNQGGMKNGTEV